ncbi:MAG TPA: response regulator [Spirochaetales bacterium]|nr:response regulator [Spirochaetales bacterium]HRY55820.1 response regulator [Spirochaetia bacterium]HRZ65059.1 response regulator [Spirochaetia bacterium]
MARVLVVEDEPLSGLELQENLERMGHEVPPVLSSADEVLPAVLAHKPDLVVMDIRLKSFTDGVDAVSRLRLVSEVPVIYLTAFPSEGSRDRASRTNPVAYLPKPVSDATLAEAVARALGQAASA